MKEKVKKKHKALLTEVFREVVKPPGSDSDSDSEYSSATEAESTTSEVEAVTSGLKRLLSSDGNELPTLKKERLSFYPQSRETTMADSDAARLEKEKAERAALKKRTEEEAAARKAEQEARDRRDREIRARREQEAAAQRQKEWEDSIRREKEAAREKERREQEAAREKERLRAEKEAERAEKEAEDFARENARLEIERQLAEAEAERVAEAAAAEAANIPPPPEVPTKADPDAMATLITLFNKRFDNMDNMLASERAERERLEQEIRSSRRHRKRSASQGISLSRREGHTRRESRSESNERTHSSWNDVASKIPIYYKETDDFGLWCDKFYDNVYKEGWDDETALQIMKNKLRGPCDRIVKKCKVRQWNWKELMDACKRRLLPGRSRNQVLLELAKVEVKLDDDPEKIMARIEAITDKACSAVSESEKQYMQAEAFRRCLTVHIPLMTYVNNNTADRNDPEELLAVAQEYFRERSAETEFYANLIQQGIRDHVQGVAKPLSEQGMFPGVQSSATTYSWKPAATSTMSQLALPAPATVQQHQGEDEEQAQILAHFIRKNEKLNNDDLIKRLNEFERFMRDCRTAGLSKSSQGNGRPNLNFKKKEDSGHPASRSWQKKDKPSYSRRTKKEMHPRYKGNKVDQNAEVQIWNAGYDIELPKGITPDDPDIEWYEKEVPVDDE